MRAGALKKRVEIHTHTSDQDSYGQANKTYTLLKTVWAGVNQLNETENETGGKTEGRSLYQFTIRDIALTKLNRLVWDSRNFEILEIINGHEKNRELIIKAYSND